jgi:hypothetical protein
VESSVKPGILNRRSYGYNANAAKLALMLRLVKLQWERNCRLQKLVDPAAALKVLLVSHSPLHLTLETEAYRLRGRGLWSHALIIPQLMESHYIRSSLSTSSSSSSSLAKLPFLTIAFLRRFYQTCLELHHHIFTSLDFAKKKIYFTEQGCRPCFQLPYLCPKW